MRRKVWLLLVVVSFLLMAYVLTRVPTSPPVSGGEAARPVAVAVPVSASERQSVKVASSPVAEVPQPRPVVPAVETQAGPDEQEELSGDSTPRVEAIILAADNRFCALIGDAIVSEGNMVHGYRVQKVHADSVEFEKDGKTWVQKVD